MFSELIAFDKLGDDRGALTVVESASLGIEIKRVYYIYDTLSDVVRGLHAHKQLNQIAFCIKGSCDFLMDNGKDKETITLDSPNLGLSIPPMVWHEMSNFSEGTVLVVLADSAYDESDYIRNYEQFREMVGA